MPVTLDYTNFFENLCKLKNMNILHHLCALFLSSLDINLGVDCLHVFVHHHHPAFYELCGIIAIILLSGQYLPQLDPRERGLFDVHEQRGKGSVSAVQLVISTCLALVTAICIFLNLPWNIVYDGHVGQEPVDVQGFHLSLLPDHQDGLHTVAVVGLHAHSFGTVVC